jgi:hypothetical protein
MTEPLTTSIATALVTGAAAALSDGVRTLVTKLASLVRERFRRNPSDQEILDSAVSAPSDHTTVRGLADALDRHMRADPVFARQLRALWTEIVAAEAGACDGVSNVIRGQVHGNVVQARDVQGGISFNAPPPARE